MKVLPCAALGPHDAVVLVSGASWNCRWPGCRYCRERNKPVEHEPLYPRHGNSPTHAAPRSPLVRAASPGAAVEDSPPASGAVSGGKP
jgi:hypothetical protein